MSRRKWHPYNIYVPLDLKVTKDSRLIISELDCCQIIILSIYVPSAHVYTHVLRLSLDLPDEER
jgi:hypothetical protein